MLIDGVLAPNIFGWGSRACIDLYHIKELSLKSTK